MCSPGFTGQDHEECAKCAAGKYKSVTGAAVCTACPAGKSSPATSDALADCANCLAGAYSLAGSPCTDCPAGTFSAAAGASACTDCPAGTFSAAAGASVASACSACAPHAQSLAGSAHCLCNAGYTGADGGPCSACAAGEYKRTAGSAACTPPLLFLNGSEARAAVEVAPYTCVIACQPPFVLLRERLQATGLWGRAVDRSIDRFGSVLLESPEVPERMWGLDANRTCVRCAEDACGVGRYPTGILCECADCVMDDALAGAA